MISECEQRTTNHNPNDKHEQISAATSEHWTDTMRPNVGSKWKREKKESLEKQTHCET